jgi:hypothetical protein
VAIDLGAFYNRVAGALRRLPESARRFRLFGHMLLAVAVRR